MTSFSGLRSTPNACFRFLLRWRLTLAGTLLHWASLANACVINYPSAESESDARQSYPVQLLSLSLNKVQSDCILQPSTLSMQQSRSMRLLETGKLVDIVWTMTTAEREQSLRPIRIPIDRGLIGWRLLLIPKAKQQPFSTVTSAEELRRFNAGQGHDWPDTVVLQHNRLPLQTSTSYEGLFLMLERGHIDYFPRSVMEVWPELDSHHQREITVDRHVVLVYPAALYFFVHRDNAVLAEKIERGLRIAQQDGSWSYLFEQHYGEAIRRSELSQRKVIALTNPLLSPQTPLDHPSLWFSVEAPQP